MESIREINTISIIFRILLSIIIGGILGMNRGRKNRPAGLRTYMLVSLGACLVIMTNQYVYQTFHVSDPVRMGAQVVSGIGFLGAGTIIVTGKKQVKGITTAAGLWAAACCGLAIGIGFYEGAIAGGVAAFFIMTAMQKLDAHIHQHSRVMEVYLELEKDIPIRNLIEYGRANDLEFSDLQIHKNKTVNTCVIIMNVYLAKGNTHNQIIEILEGATGVVYIEEL